MKLFVNVRCVNPSPDTDEDAGVEGVYEVQFQSSTTELSLPKLASAALDIFHSQFGIGVLEDFDISVVNEQHELVEEDSSHESYSFKDIGVVSKINDQPYIDFSDDVGLSAEELDQKYNPDGDGEHPHYSRADWRAEVAHHNTISGYWEWVAHLLSSESVNMLISPFQPTTFVEAGNEYFPGATLEEIGSVMMQDIVGDYDTPDLIPEWKWIEAHASFVHRDNGKNGVWEFVLNMARDLSSAPATLLPFLTEAKQKQLAYVIFHQGT